MKFKDLKPRQKQYLYATLASLISISVIGGVFWNLFEDNDFTTEAPKEFSHETNIASAGRVISQKEVWVEKMETENKQLTEKLEGLEKLLIDNMRLMEERNIEVQQLREEVSTFQSAPPPALSINSSSMDGNIFPSLEGNSLPGMPEALPEKGIKKLTFNLKQKAQQKVKKTVENTIPAGAYAKAILLGGVDASTSVSSSSDPRPVLLRIADKGTLPRRFESDLKDCHVLASSYGDLSSERVYMRLEKLTCTEILTGEIIETQVAGYIAGEDGKAGVRGIVVDRAGEAVRSSFIAGFLGGISNFFSAEQQRSIYPVSPFGQTNALSSQQMFNAGSARGASNAMDRFAEFYIKRAEQLQPVLEVAAGRTVDIIFTQGTEFGETSVKKTLHKIREETRRETVESLEEQGDLKHWLPKVGDNT